MQRSVSVSNGTSTSSNFLPRRPIRPTAPTVRGSYDPRIMTVQPNPNEPTRIFTTAASTPQTTSSIKTESA
jgi:hypothetical protein